MPPAEFQQFVRVNSTPVSYFGNLKLHSWMANLLHLSKAGNSCFLIHSFQFSVHFSCGAAAQRGAMASSFLRFLDHTQWRTTFSRTPLYEWSARRRDLYLTTHNTHNRQIVRHVPGGIRTHDLSRRAAADLLLRPRSHWDRLFSIHGLLNELELWNRCYINREFTWTKQQHEGVRELNDWAWDRGKVARNCKHAENFLITWFYGLLRTLA